MAERLWCQRCDRYPSGATTMEFSREFDGRIFKGKVGAQRCLKCRQKYPDQDAAEDLERRIALRLALSWPPSGASMKLLRKVIGLSAKGLAVLIDVKPETVSRWEHGRLTPGKQTIALLAQLAEKSHHCRARETLEQLKKPRPLAATILLDRR